MRLKIIPGFVILSLLLFCYSCDNYPDAKSIERSEQAVFFTVDWYYDFGDIFRGILIDSVGNVYVYNHPETWVYPDSLGVISKADMEANLAAATMVALSIDKDVLYDKIDQIDLLKYGELNDPISGWVAGWGMITYRAYTYSKLSKKYKATIFQVDGDVKQLFTLDIGTQLFEWLETVADEAYIEYNDMQELSR